ncbi:MAG: alpha amylase C-terminal domain-containing protein [Thermodesulfobacteriota bacterium]|nr:alpha amylase C-terminal domain-containing protein [Thermodesulfobacteriota bacterium]
MKPCLTAHSLSDPILSEPGIFNDRYLLPYAGKIRERLEYIKNRERELTKEYSSLYDFADYHLFFGLHFHDNQWIFREWAPNACSVHIIGDMNNWQIEEEFSLVQKRKNGVWQGIFKKNVFKHGDLYKLKIGWENGVGERIPTAATRVVQDSETLIFTAQVQNHEKKYRWRCKTPVYKFDHKVHGKSDDKPRDKDQSLIIYEAHVGMAQEQGRVGSYEEFEKNILPVIKDAGYNTIQLMAVQEHPYYGSFGYHVSNFFAVSSRFGTCNELKSLIDTAHSLGIRVLIDIVHSHAVNNEDEGISRFDGTSDQFFYTGERGYHRLWDSRCFDYSRDMVVKFLLSNCRYFMEEFNVDGFRFDGITSMLFKDHGISRNFTTYDDYFKGNDVDEDALAYLFFANRLIHEILPSAKTIAEDVSGYPGIAASADKGGTGFDFRFAMGIPDFWIKLLKDYRDEEWPLGWLWHELNSRRDDEKSISYAESHDQALVGDQTIMMRLMGQNIYSSMKTDNKSIQTFRGVALHKMIRLITIATAGNGYLNFMGNEFGHPEWIDFPGVQNNWSYHYARRQWSLKENNDLFYSRLAEFDRQMIKLIKKYCLFESHRADLLYIHEADRIIIFKRGSLVFVFNFNDCKSFSDYMFDAPAGKYKMILNTDTLEFGGGERLVSDQVHYSIHNYEKYGDRNFLSLYLPTRTAIVLLTINN